MSLQRTRRFGRRWRWLRRTGWLLVLLLITVRWCDGRVSREAGPHVQDRMLQLPTHRVGLVLGTSHRMRGGGANPWFHRRMQAAAELYHAGRVEVLLVSGDNTTNTYNEPRAMQRALIELGVDSTRIVLDHAGLRTLDSVLRAREVFGQQSFTIISQRFQAERAVYIARHHGIDAVGYAARDVPGMVGLRTRLREQGARVKVFLDLAFGKGPRHLGERIAIPSVPVPDEDDSDG
jgi:SanA protein